MKNTFRNLMNQELINNTKENDFDFFSNGLLWGLFIPGFICWLILRFVLQKKEIEVG